MVFSSTIFLFLFLPITLAVYYLLQKRYRNYWLLVVSLIFFSWSQPHYLWIILTNIAVNYCSALLMQYKKSKKIVLFLCLCTNLGLLIYFKYFDFLIDSVNSIFNKSFTLPGIVLPIGISFFTFQGMSYAIDVYRDQVPIQKNPLKVALYILLFPQLIAGPIVRYIDVVEEIDNRSVDINDFSCGIERFIIGLTKKSIFSNTMAVVADSIWAKGAGNNSCAVAWLGSIAYTLQIYYDFSGYSDMAIGLGRMFGFHFNENFNLPYISKSITEFWRRWHISLSTWFRDYVYIPLGGGRKNVQRNLIIIFLLTGIWHGASWTFILWGIWNGIFRLIERFFTSHVKKSNSKLSQKHLLKDILGVCYTLFIVNIGWVLFRAETINDAILYIQNMFGKVQTTTGYTLASYLDNWTIFILILGLIFASSIPTALKDAVILKMNHKLVTVLKYIALIALFYIVIIRIVAGTYNPFIYFQF